MVRRGSPLLRFHHRREGRPNVARPQEAHILFGRSPQRTSERRSARSRLDEAGRRILSELDTEGVVRAAAEEVLRSLRLRAVSVWLTTGTDPPRLAYAAVGDEPFDRPHPDGGAPAPATVIECARTRRPAQNPLAGDLSVPVVAPQSGLVGVLHLSGRSWATEQMDLVQAVAREAGLALEMAHLYERALAEREKSDAILAKVGDAVVVTDPRGLMLQWNPAAGRIIGRTEDQIRGSRCEQILGLRAGERVLDCSSGCALLAGSAGDPQGDVEVWRPGAERRQPLLASVEAVHAPDGSITEIVHSFRDISKLKEADEAKTLFLATATHELKTPLTVIRGFVDTLINHPDVTEDMRDTALRAIARRTVELGAIVDRLLLTSRIESGQVQVRLGEVALSALVTERAHAIAASTARTVDVVLDEELPFVLGDEDAIVTVLDHLLDNAIKYSPAGGPVTVTARAVEDLVHLSVVDPGIGMDDEQTAHCFDKFWQAEPGQTRRFRGTGIGLYIVKSLVDAMGAEVRVDSAPGSGSTFTVSLPKIGAPALPKPPTVAVPTPGVAEQSTIREFMRQMGIPARREQ